MRELNLKTVRDYCRYIFLDKSGKELEELVNLIIISETYFFRDYTQLQFLAETLLPLITAEKSRQKQLNILSAGCSTGEEPYTLAIILEEMLDEPNTWNIRLDGIDINTKSLRKGEEGIYTNHALRETPYQYRDSYFSKQATDTYVLAPEIKKMVRFSRMNLFDKAQVATLCSYDLVFCRNVLIYFDRQSAGQVMEHFYEIMNPGAFIFLGSAESVGRLSSLFTMIRFGKSFAYRK